jgi:hypothetical protein
MSDEFRLLMISAMYENGGNTTHRLFDGHPQMFVYPFESQLGTRLVNDHLSSLYPVKYRWPVFSLEATAAQDYEAIIDEEGKVRAKTPQVSKFRHIEFNLDDRERRGRYVEIVDEIGRSRANNVAAFFRATFDVWKNLKRSGEESIYVGYSPVIGIDAGKIVNDLPGAHVLNIVRNPYSAYADTKKRAVPLSLEHYLTGWCVHQYHALLFKALYPGRVHVVRFEDIVENPVNALGAVCEALGARVAETLAQPSWNGEALDEVYPWGTIRTATAQANRATAAELSDAERDEIGLRALPLLEQCGYDT